ncbi:MAG: helix-turn-helix domain-containing protein [Verrucomicrobia bacterium]|nr:helix-turn-helix domain-containing protein [Verrucomicrobiota bacterium]MCF7709391.1 helix-turn-helix domain-containing protein [Verrucomicrobiota bacterium]
MHENHPERKIQQKNLDISSLFASRLRCWRKSRQIPIKQIAADLNVSVAVVSSWEHGTRFPSVTNLENISAYTGIPVWQFFYEIMPNELEKNPFYDE